MRPAQTAPCNARYKARWVNQIFDAKSARKGGVMRRAVRDVEREIGCDVLFHEVKRRSFHVLECGDQFIILCSANRLHVHF